MPFLDRFWWLRIVGAIGLVGVAVGMAAVGISSYQADEEFHFGHETTWFTVAFAACFVAGMLILFLMVAAKLLIDTPPARRRKMLRLRALAGDTDAMPLAASQPNPEAAPSVDLEPLDFLWRPGKPIRILAGVVIVILVPCFSAFAALGAWAIVFALTHANYSDAFSPAIVVGSFAAIALMGLSCATAFAVFFVADVIGTRRGMSAAADGLYQLTPQGRRRSISWHQLRLIEHALDTPSSPGTSGCLYIFYGERQVIRWLDYLKLSPTTSPVRRSAEPWIDLDGVSRPMIKQRARDILNVIAARTGQQSRTPYRQLQPPPAS